MSYNPIISFDLFSNLCSYKFENEIILNEFINYIENDNNIKKTFTDKIIINKVDNKIIFDDIGNNHILNKWKSLKTNNLNNIN